MDSDYFQCQELRCLIKKGNRQKSSSTSGPTFKRERERGGGKGRTTKKKQLFLKLEKKKSKKMRPLRGIRALGVGPLKKICFLRLPLTFHLL